MSQKPRLIVTSGPTREYFDPIRFLSNPSTGKMGHSIATAGIDAGYEVIYISGPVPEVYATVNGAQNISIISTLDLLDAVLRNLTPDCSLIMAAAPADYRPDKKSAIKLKKTESPVLNLVPNPDILKSAREYTDKEKLPVTLVGFAAETHNVEEYAKEKLRVKKLDMIFLNDVSRSDSGFGSETNQLTLFRKDGSVEKWSTMNKDALGGKIISELTRWRLAHQAG